MRALRPDGICYKAICGTEAWREYVSNRTVPFSESFEGAGPITPIFFVLSPEMGPLKGSLGKKLGYTVRTSTILLGQGWEEIPETAMELASKEKHWVCLQNIHLVKLWLPTL